MTSIMQIKMMSFTQLIFRAKIGKMSIKSCDATRVVVINDEIAIPCTQKEYQIFMMALDLKPITDLALIHELFGCAPDGSILDTVRRHVERLREKIKPAGLSIPRIQGYGYLLVELQELNMF